MIQTYILAVLLASQVIDTSNGSPATMGPPERRRALQRAIDHAPEIANVRRDVTYATVDGIDLAADVFFPNVAANGRRYPMFIWIHGGGWRWGFKELGEYTCRYVASKGYVAININYRLAPKHKFPAAVNDCLGAVVWAKRNAATFNGDPERVAVGGESAGGNLAAMVAYASASKAFTPSGAKRGDPSANVQAAVPVYAALDLVPMLQGERRNVMLQYLAYNAEAELASPTKYVGPESVPTLLICGDKDFLYDQSVAFSKRLAELGVHHQFIVPPGAEHAFIVFGYGTENFDNAHRGIMEFLDRQFKRSEP